MTTNRIQKLLFSEYCDFEDMVLLESPFAQTTRDGKGVRQIQMGLTPTKLILAADVLEMADDEISYTTCLEAGKIGLDPEIESLELVSIFPVEAVNLSIFRKNRRNTLKAHFCNEEVLYFELGGTHKRRMFWNLWQERVKYLSPNEGGSSLSETSVGSSSSLSTLYIADSCLSFSENGRTQLFCNYNAVIPSPTTLEPSTCGWKDKDLYLGPHYCCDYNTINEPISCPSMKCCVNNQNYYHRVIASKSDNEATRYDYEKNELPIPIRLRSVSSASVLERGPSCMHFVNRFGYGIRDSNATLFFLEQHAKEVDLENNKQENNDVIDMYEIVENGVTSWEKNKHKHIRRYAFSPQPHFLHGLGPWKVPPGETYSVQIKRAVSMVNIRRQPADHTFRLPISRRQLTTTISCEALHIMPRCNPAKATNIKFVSPTSPVIFFWTPDYWYRPRSACAAYNELLSHLHSINKMHDVNDCSSASFILDNSVDSKGKCTKSNGFWSSHRKARSRRNEGTTKLRRILKMDEVFSAWQFDSATLSYQLTMIDRELFLKIQVTELATLVWQQSSKFAPNVGAVIAFSHRISCLIATEILKEPLLRKRARLVARFINVADKCHKLRNYQSTRSILCGLQSPPIYRLKETWSYLRHHHATKYQRLETLCRKYRDPRLPLYQQMFKQGSVTPPYLPSVAHILCLLLDRLEEYSESVLLKHSVSSVDKSCILNQGWRNYIGKSAIPKSFQRILSAFRIWPNSNDSNSTSHESDEENNNDDDDTPSIIAELKFNRFISSLSADFEVDSTKTNHLEQVSTSFIIWQRAALLYALQETPKAKEYLLKARYREDKENFSLSLSLEPVVDKNEE